MFQFNSSQTHRFTEFEIWPLETKVNQGRTDFNYTSPETCGPQESGSLNPDKDLVWMVKKHSLFMYLIVEYCGFCRIVATSISVAPICVHQRQFFGEPYWIATKCLRHLSPRFVKETLRAMDLEGARKQCSKHTKMWGKLWKQDSWILTRAEFISKLLCTLIFVNSQLSRKRWLNLNGEFGEPLS